MRVRYKDVFLRRRAVKIMAKILFTALLAITGSAFADIKIPMYLTVKTGSGSSIGYVLAKQTSYGVLFTPHLHGLPAGVHGFHIHQNPVCSDTGMGAGGHLDPENTGKHLGPYNDQGHLGDLPVLIVNNQGVADIPILAPRLKLSDIEKHSLMIHQGGDNYSDEPQPLGGGGPRIACGIIP